VYKPVGQNIEDKEGEGRMNRRRRRRGGKEEEKHKIKHEKMEQINKKKRVKRDLFLMSGVKRA
jgi:hypothetical protein